MYNISGLLLNKMIANKIKIKNNQKIWISFGTETISFNGDSLKSFRTFIFYFILLFLNYYYYYNIYFYLCVILYFTFESLKVKYFLFNFKNN